MHTLFLSSSLTLAKMFLEREEEEEEKDDASTMEAFGFS